MDLCEFEASLVYRASSRTAMATQRNPVKKKKKKKKLLVPREIANCCEILLPTGMAILREMDTSKCWPGSGEIRAPAWLEEKS